MFVAWTPDSLKQWDDTANGGAATDPGGWTTWQSRCLPPSQAVMMLDIISIGMTPPLGTAPSFYPGPLPPGKNSRIGFGGCSFYQCWGELDLRFFSGALYFLLAVWTSLPESHSWPESKKKVSGDMIKVTYMMVKNLRSSPSSSICLISLMPLESSFSWFHFPLVIIRRGNKWSNTHLCRAWWGIIAMMTLSTLHCRYLIKYICDLVLKITLHDRLYSSLQRENWNLEYWGNLPETAQLINDRTRILSQPLPCLKTHSFFTIPLCFWWENK